MNTTERPAKKLKAFTISLFFIALLLLIQPSIAASPPQTYAQVTSLVPSLVDTVQDSDEAAEIYFKNRSYEVAAFAKATLGSVHGYAESAGSGISKRVGASAYFRDTINLTTADNRKESGWIDLALDYTWKFVLPAQGAGITAGISAEVNGLSRGVSTIINSGEGGRLFYTSSVIDSSSNPFGGRIVARYRINLNSENDIKVGVGIQVANNSTGRAIADIGNSVYWGGVVAVYAADMTPVDFSISALSGTNYLNAMTPVPETSTNILIIIGAIFILLLQYRQKIKPALGTCNLKPFARKSYCEKSGA